MTEFTLNRLANSSNPYQGEAKKVLCLCSAGLLRSPTTAVVLSQPPYNFNTRAAGVTQEYALIPVDQVLLRWADEIVCVEQRIFDALEDQFDESILADKDITVLSIPDRFPYRDPALMEIIRKQYDEAHAEETVEPA